MYLLIVGLYGTIMPYWRRSSFFSSFPRKEEIPVEERKNSAARIRANNKYAAKAYDRINIAVPKGRKDKIKALADTRGQSVNAYIISAIDEKMEQDSGGTASEIAEKGPESAQGAWMVSLPSETLRAAQEAAQSAGETVSQFVERAVSIQAQRDQASLKIGINPVAGTKLETEQE